MYQKNLDQKSFLFTFEKSYFLSDVKFTFRYKTKVPNIDFFKISSGFFITRYN